MAATRTLNFLPEIFRTDTNKKFLAATVDQLISEPNFKKINGYIGRRVTPTFKPSDSYITEPSRARQNYQLEPCAVVKDTYTNRVDFFSSYPDLLQKIEYYGGITNNHDRLFKNEFYTFDGCFDFDKFINFNSYYWIPNGPDAVSVFAGSVDSEGEYRVTRNLSVGGFNFSSKGTESNPVMILSRGGTYRFQVEQPGHRFWIQSEPGRSGTKNTQPNVSTREVFGVSNNGIDQGTVTFRVPQQTAQDKFTSMTLAAVADLATTISYVDIQDHSLREFLKSNPDGIDGYRTITDLDGKYIIFVNDDIDDIFWTNDEIFDVYPYDVVVSETIPEPQRRNLWRIQLIPSGKDHVIRLTPSTTVEKNQKVFVRRGKENASREFYTDFDGIYQRVPNITANLDRLFYQDSRDPTFVGEIRIVDPDNFVIDVNNDILGEKNYTSPNGVEFTNGLKIRFDNKVIPSDYRLKEFYVEGVGKSITLVETNELINPEPYAGSLEALDYLTINRGSRDLNAWSRSNRWFHIDVLKATAAYNKTVGLPDQKYRANRPIIEFEADLQLFNFGQQGLPPVDYLDFYVTDAFSQIEGNGKQYDSLQHYAKDEVVIIENKVYRARIDLQQIPGDNNNWQNLYRLSDYSGTQAYRQDSVVRYQDRIYRALSITNDNVPTDTTYWQPIIWNRENIDIFDLTVEYQQFDAVYYNDEYYACISPNGSVQISPDSTTNWKKVDVFVDYTEELADTILENQHATWQGRLYRATMDIMQNPTDNDLYWEKIIDIVDGKSVIFAGDQDPIVRNIVYRLSMEDIGNDEDPDGNPIRVPHLTPSAFTVDSNSTVVVLEGINAALSFWYNGDRWIQAPQKTSINQAPLFDVVDENNISLGDKTRYPNSTFAGTRIFSYKTGPGKPDPVLGFALSYRNFNSVGDIEFSNDFDNSSMTFLDGTQEKTVKLNSGYLLNYIDRGTTQPRNTWVKAKEKSHQYQIFSHVFDGTTNYFEVDVAPVESQQIPYIKVFVNNELVKEYQYVYEVVGARQAVRILSSLLTPGAIIDIMIYSDSSSELGYYEIPSNLDYNSQNSDFEYLTLGQLKNHISKLVENTRITNQSETKFTGFRDIQFKDHSGTILQHASPSIYSNLFLVDDNVNFVNSIELAAREYTKFKNKFLEAASKLTSVDPDQIPEVVNEIIKSINLVKNSSFPWYYSDMVPYGDNRSDYLDVVINPELRQFDLPMVFNDQQLSNRAVLVYVNNKQLTKDRDYYFPQDRTAVIISDDYPLEADDKIKIVDYLDTNGCYVPETPSKMGLYPKFVPGKLYDNTYRVPTYVIQGHDGSLTPAFGDYRDDLLLELETRIYNNIKIDYHAGIANIHDFIPGKFRDTEYSLAEFDRILSRSFLKWVGNNQIDYTTNANFVANDPWTWNYSKYRDTINGGRIPGAWRAIFKYFYDTDRPNTHPWEMLGFSEEPNWWQERYGVAPYTGGNLLLWQDLAQGYIHAGPRKGIDTRYARPALLSIIPVDEYGALRSPNQFAVSNFNSSDAGRAFSIGNQGPAETAWRRSSDYPFALQRTMALTQPAFYFGSLFDIKTYNRSAKLDQLVIADSLRRVTPHTIKVHGNNVNGQTQLTAGYLNWIRDYVKNLGQDPVTVIRHRLDNLDVNLGYRVAGYTDKNYIKVLAEQSSPTSTNDSIIVPDENYTVHLNKSSPLKKIIYSAVIIEKTSNGYTVSGYDVANPYFTIIPSLANNNAYVVEVINQRGVIYRDYQSKKVVVPYGFEFASRQQVVDFLISYGRYLTGQGIKFTETDEVLSAKKDWVLSVKEFLHWSQQGWSNGNLIILSPIKDVLKISTPTGVIDHVENTINGSKILDQQFSTIKNNQFTVVRSNNEFKISVIDDRTICFAELEVVQFEHVLIFDNSTVFNDIIYKPELGNRQFRLKLVGNKTNDWAGELNPPGFIYNASDVDPWLPGKDYKKGSIVNFKEQYYTALENIIAAAEFNQAQWRLIERAAIKTGLLPNFAYNAQKFEDIYDIDNAPADSNLLEYSAGLIGFRERTYLSDFSLDNVSQVKFYQGFIKDKGTRSSVDALTTARFNNVTSGLDLYEEWALRVGEYGAIESDAQIEIVLNDSEITNDPSVIALLDSNEISESGTVAIREKDLYRRTTSYKKDIFFNRSGRTDDSADISTAGFVNLEDISGTLFDIRNFNELDSLLPSIGKGFKLWVARDFDNDWNVYRISETDNNVSSAIYDLDDQISVTFDKPHGLEVGEIFIIKNLNALIDGFYQVAYVTDLSRVMAKIYKNQSEIKKTRNFSGNGVYLIAKPMRSDSARNIDQLTPLNGWLSGDCVWVNSVDRDGHWGVYEKNDSWKYQIELPVESSDLAGNDRFGHVVKINSQNDLIVVSSPTNIDGNIKTFVKLTSGEFKQSSTFRPTQVLTVEGFGKAMDLVDYRVSVGAPDSETGRGLVFVYNFRAEKEKFDLQTLFSPSEEPDSQFGHSLSMSKDSQWLYVGAPGKDTVYVYHFDRSLTDLDTQVLVTVPGQTDYALDFPIASAESIRVTAEFSLPDLFTGDGVTDTFTLSDTLVGRRLQIIVNNQLLLPSDYTIDGNTLTLGTVPNDGNVIVARINQSILLQPGVDYTVTEQGELSLSKDPGSLSIEVQQAHYYKLVDAITGSPGSRFGHAIRTNHDGSILVVGAPDKTIIANGVTYNKTGTAYVYARRVEEQPLKSNQSTYVPASVSTPFVDLSVGGVLLHQVEDYTLIDNEIVLLKSFEAGQTLTISTSQIDLLREISSPDLVDQGNFGFSLDMDQDSNSIYVGAPNYYDANYNQGKVYRFTTKSKYIGNTSSRQPNPVLPAGLTLYVNRVPVTFTSSNDNDEATAESMAIDISRVTGVTATVDQDGRLVISSTSKINKNLEIMPAGNDALEQIGFDTYVLDQEILEPDFNEGSFGSNIVVDRLGETVSITGKNSSLTQTITFDTSTGAGTTFDIGTTLFKQVVPGSGAVYLYEMINDSQTGVSNTGSVIFSDKLSLQNVYPGDEFGFSVSLQNNAMVVSSPGFDPLPLASQYDLKVNNLDELSWMGVNALAVGTRVLVVSDVSNQGIWSIWVYNGAQSTDFRSNFTRASIGVIKNTGTVHLYNNPLSKRIWDLKRKQSPVVDLDSVNRVLIYDRSRNSIITNLDYIDPAKGKILGVAEQDIDFKTELDPAIYTNGTSEVVVDQGMRWGEQQVGMIWWNLSKVRYLDYEQADLIYRTKNWGSMFPGSEIEICEWVSSSVPPDQYAARGGSGIPKYNNQVYVVDTVIDSQSGILNPRYYFWVVGKQDVSVGRKRNSCAAIADIIENPNLQGIPYAGILKSNALALYGVNEYLSGSNVVLQVDYANVPNSNLVHTEFELVQENRRESEIPYKIVNKMVDSLAGIDRVGNVVPDPTLKDNERVGISYRPRQSMFRDRERALRSVIDFVNNVFLTYPVVRQFNINGFLGQDPVPGPAGYDRKVSTVDELGYINTEEIEVGYRVLIENDSTNDGLWTVWRFNGSRFALSRIQSYKTNLYWEYRNWYADGFDPSTKVTYTVDYEKDIGALNLRAGDIIAVRYDQQGQSVTYRVNDDRSLTVVALENGTIQFLPSLYNINNDGMGFDSSNFDNVRYDKTPGVEIRQILESIRKDIFVGEFKQEFNRMFFVLVNYLLTEQKHVDWIFKTSFVNIVHKLRKLEQYPSFVRDNQDYYIDYINEVKPYRTQIREYLLNYDGIDVVGGNVGDFDLPAYYDKILDQYRTPNGERDSDEDLLSEREYQSWNQSHRLVVDRVVVETPGTGYTVIPQVTIEGGGGRGAKAVATIDFNGVTSITVTDPGSGYTSTPQVVINGNGVGAAAYPMMKNVHMGNDQLGYNLVRSVNSTIKLDRIAYDTQIPAWTANSEIFSDRVSHLNEIYKINESNIYVVPMQLSGIETFEVELISTFQVENTDLTPSTVVNINNVEATFGIDYSLNLEDNTITVLDPRLEDEVSIRYVGDEGEDLYETFLVETPRVYQLNKSAKEYFDDLENVEYRVYLGDQLQSMSLYEFSEDLRTLEFVNYPTPGLQIKVNVENNVIFAVPPEDVPGAIYDDESDSWSIIIEGKSVPIGSINDIVAGQRVRGSGVNNFNNIVMVLEKDNNGTVRLQSETKTKTTRGRWEGKEWIPGNEITYRDPAILVQGKNTIELMYFISPINTEQFFDYRAFTRVNGDDAGHAIDRAVAYYQPVEGGEGQDPSQVIKGITYPGVKVQGLPFNQDEELSSVSALIDSHISSRYRDIALGTRPEDITITGGAYVDLYSSHAPEELVPGIIFDSLNMQVFTKPINPWNSGDEERFVGDGFTTDFVYTNNLLNDSNTVILVGEVPAKKGIDYVFSGDKIVFEEAPQAGKEIRVVGFEVTGKPLAYRIFHNMAEDRNYYRIAEAYSTILAQPLAITDTQIRVVNASVLSQPTSRQPGVLFIDGEMITFLELDTVNNLVKRIRRGVNGTGAPAQHPAGRRVVDTSEIQRLPGQADTARWLNSSAEFGFREIGDFDYTGYDEEEFDILIQIADASLVPTEQARFLAKSPGFNR